jgi:hypothetical protein
MISSQTLKTIAAACGGWLWAVAGPALPFGVVCTAMVIADVVSARRLAHRLQQKVPSKRQQLKFSSARFGRVIATLIRIYSVLILAAMIDNVIGVPGISMLKFVAGAVCFWQAVSVLENEASANGATWAKMLGRILIDKTERYLGVTLDELRQDSTQKSEKSP